MWLYSISIKYSSQVRVSTRHLMIYPLNLTHTTYLDQLMLDTMKGGSPYNMPPINAASRHDDELLRQQEAFINQNRMHIEKRRHERSPEHEHRERSYSPPAASLSSSSSRRDRRPYSRERDANAGRKPIAASNSGSSSAPYARRDEAGRGRRAGSRDVQQHSSSGGTTTNSTPSKRRKSASIERSEPQSSTREVKVNSQNHALNFVFNQY